MREQQRLDASIRRAKGWAEKAHRDSTKKEGSGLSMGVKEGKRKKAEKLERAARNRVRRLERLKQDVGERPHPEAQVRFSVDAAEKRGKRILEVSGLQKSFGERVLFSETSFTLSRGEHVALFGPNGCGKTTFLRILAQELAPDAGTVRLSPSCRPFLLWQDFSAQPGTADGDCSPLQYFSRAFGGLTGEQRTLLANMGLTARHMRQPISTLSYGEQMKLRLAELIFSRRDFLVLDEPTNYLDLHARETLEQALSSYDGTLLLVSHDLYFLKAVCDRVLLMEGGRIQRLECSFAEYLERRGHTREP